LLSLRKGNVEKRLQPFGNEIQDKDATNYQKELTQVWDESRSEEQLSELPKEISCPLNFWCFFLDVIKKSQNNEG